MLHKVSKMIGHFEQYLKVIRIHSLKSANLILFTLKKITFVIFALHSSSFSNIKACRLAFMDRSTKV